MPSVLTALTVESTKSDPAGRREIADGALPGFYLVVQPSGAKSWAFRYRHASKPKKLTIGPVLLKREGEKPDSLPLGSAMTLTEARTVARGAMQSVQEGNDPAAVKRAVRTAPVVDPDRDLVPTLGVQFIERYCKPRNRTWPEIERQFKVEINPKWGRRRVQEIAKRDVLELLDDIIDRGSPITANRVFATLRKFFGWLIERDVVTASPCVGMTKPSPETARERVLADDELRLFWRATGELGYPFGPMFRMLLITGQRREEVAAMTRAELQLDGASPTWSLPGSRTKNKNAHAVPLSPLAVDTIAGLPKIGKAGFVFTTTGETPTTGYSRAKTRLDKIMGRILAEDDAGDDEPTRLQHFTLHDLRRTVASGMQRLNINLPVVEKALNHVSGSFAGIVGVYQRHEFADEKRAAMKAWASFLADLTARSARPNVVALRPPTFSGSEKVLA